MQFISPPLNTIPCEVMLDSGESFHALKVLRFRKNDKIKLFDGRFKYNGFIKDIIDERVIVYVTEKREDNIKKHRVNLYLPFIDKRDFEEVVRCCSEMGVDSFFPLITRYTQLDKNIRSSDINRLERIIVAAVKQSESASFSRIEKSVSFQELASSGKKVICGFIGGLKRMSIKKAIEVMGDEINIMIGPEGGFSEDEKRIIDERFFTVKLSNNILTSKTAAISLVASVMYHISNEDIF
ncbi:MAG: RsmE family RNA methyltransferase [Elusimicrobiales bacterium]